jgi:hypothetical protein
MHWLFASAFKGRTTMKFRPILMAAVLAIMLATTAWSDQIVLKNGQEYSGKFIRGDANVVEFRILSRVESFKTAEVAQIIFKEPAMQQTAASPATSAKAPVASAGVASPSHPPVAQPVSSQPTTQQLPSQTSQITVVTAPAGAALTIRTTDAIDTDRNHAGDVFDATLEDPLTIDNQTVATKGTLVHGRIANSKEAGKLTGQSELVLELTDIVLGGKNYPIHTADYSEVGASRGRRSAATVGGTAALGAIIGAIAGGGKGAAIGAASGAAVGTGVQILTKGQTLKIPAETILELIRVKVIRQRGALEPLLPGCMHAHNSNLKPPF